MAIVRILPPGSFSNFARNSSGYAYGLNGDNGFKFPLIIRPMEVLAGSAVQSSCIQSGIDEFLEQFIIPAGTLGPNSTLQIEPLWTFTNSVSNKFLKVKLDTVTLYSAIRTNSVKESPFISLVNRNSLSSQIQPYDNAGYVTAGSVLPVTYNIDFSIDVIVYFIGQRASVSDTLTLEYYRCLHFLGD